MLNQNLSDNGKHLRICIQLNEGFPSVLWLMTKSFVVGMSTGQLPTCESKRWLPCGLLTIWILEWRFPVMGESITPPVLQRALPESESLTTLNVF